MNSWESDEYKFIKKSALDELLKAYECLRLKNEKLIKVLKKIDDTYGCNSMAYEVLKELGEIE